MFNQHLVAIVSLGLVCVLAYHPSAKTLDDANKRLDTILNNTRSRENYIRCFLDKGICSRDALDLKRVLGDALINNCTNCTDIQKMSVERFFSYLMNHQPETWRTVMSKYDPSAPQDSYIGVIDMDDDGDDGDEDDDDSHEHNYKSLSNHINGTVSNNRSVSSTLPTV